MKCLSKFGFLLGVACLSLYSCKKSAVQIEEPTVKPETQQTIPTVKTTEIKNITAINALGGGLVVETGGAAVTERGLVFGTSVNPTLQNSKTGTISVNGNGEFVSELTNLKPSTVYYVRAFAVNKVGIAYGEEISFTSSYEIGAKKPVLLLDSTSFSSQQKFESLWNMFYPWGTDHNGAARMYKEQVSILSNGILQINANRYEAWEGYSTADPWLRIFYHSGAVHLKEKITVTDAKPYWVISGDFQVPSNTGTWPAFWITGVNSWPPESDIMEFKGTSTNWQNTATGPDWQNVSWQNKLTTVTNPQDWHNYKIVMERMNNVNLTVTYYIDNVKTATHTANFMNKAFWLIINMQMDGASGTTTSALQTATMKGRNIYVAAYPN